ncbi:MAG: hypothetical protein ACD_62C00400G0006 [uncultured bacterium]|nr:MAG: hypothetical protein ACD_62C00400G0006 [uncultured bacterium]HLD44831.1 acyl carrier protein [bacterium]
MAKALLESKIIDIIAAQLSLRNSDIKLSSHFIDDLGADSLDVVELIMEIEDVFGIEIPDEDVEEMETVEDVINYVAKTK